MIKLTINPNFRKFIHLELTKSRSKMKFTHKIVGSTLLINPMDLECVEKAMKRLELRLK
jgi:hypothetical protein